MDEQSSEGELLLQKVMNMLSPAPLPEPGERVGGLEGNRYELLELLGSGGMGRVFLALDHELQRLVALKFLLPGPGVSEPELMAVLRKEAQAIAQLEHENIVGIHDVSAWNLQGEEGETLWRVPFIIMEYLRGQSLHSLLRGRRPGLSRALRIMCDVAAGLAHAHERHLVHCDLKPGNIFLLNNGRVKLLDFGLARLVKGATGGSREAQGGTPAYMSPGQWRKQPPDARDDIWAAGLVLFEMLAGMLPFPAMPAGELREYMLSSEPLPSVLEFCPDLPEGVEPLLVATLSKDPARRPAHGGELLNRLRALREQVMPKAGRPPLLAAERRQVTLVHCQLVLAPTGAEPLDPEDYGELETAFHRTCSRLIRQQGGTMTSCLGDEVLACFGYPHVKESDSECAVRAALQLRQTIPRELSCLYPPGLSVRVGVHTGLVTLGTTPSEPEERTPTMQGEAPRVAAWLAHRADLGTVVMSDRTQSLVRGTFRTQDLGYRILEGSPRPLRLGLYQVLNERQFACRFDKALVAGVLTPLVGREREMRRLLGLWDKAMAGDSTFVLIRGEAGMGKSRLVQELHDRSSIPHCTWARCQCWSQSSNTAFHPIIDWLHRFLDLAAEEGLQQKLQRLHARLDALGLPPEHVPPLSALLSLTSTEEGTLLPTAPERQRERLLQAVTALLRRVAAQGPLALVVEDLHWADPSTLQLLGYLHEHLGKARVCVLLTARPEFQPPWQANLHMLELERLSPDGTATLAREAAGGKPLPRNVLEQLVARADGVPFFIEELTRVVVEQEEPATHPAATHLAPIPATLQELLMARLDQLPPEREALVQLAATLGRDFSYQLFLAVAAREEEELQQELAHLERAGLLFHQGESPYAVSYTFKHSLLQDAAYQSMSRGKRQRYHARIARVLAEQFPDINDEQPEMLAQHLSQAGQVEEAVTWWMLAGRHAEAKSALPEAINHFSQALQKLSLLKDSQQRLRQHVTLQVDLGHALIASRGYSSQEAEEAFSSARKLCEQLGDVPVPVLWGLFASHVVQGNRESTHSLAPVVLRMLETHTEPTTHVALWPALAVWAFWWGDLAECERYCALAKEAAARHHVLERLEQLHESGQSYVAENLLYAHLFMSFSQIVMGKVRESRLSHEQGLALAEAVDNPYMATTGFMLGAVDEYEAVAPSAVRELSGRALALATENGFTFLMAISSCLNGWSLARLGERQAGLARLKEGLAMIRAIGAMVVYPYYMNALANLYLEDGRLAEGLAAADEGLALAERSLPRLTATELRRVRGELLWRQGRGPEARASLEQALALARGHGARLYALRAALALAHLLRQQGEAAQARQLLADTYGPFAGEPELPDCAAARLLLAELA